MARKKLPIGIQTFEKIREDDYYYVDKTRYILQLIDEGTHYFLSRPRRFGKSLLLDTIGELFSGNEMLFQGLYCHDRWDWSKRYPVIRISFGGGVVRNLTELETRIRALLRTNRENLGVSCGDEADIPGCFAELIRNAAKTEGERVVVLIDEYDKPILDNITQPELATEIRHGLRNLYSVIKDSDAHIRFAFLTGVSKFSKASLFSGLNNLEDITVSSPYSALCGYTEGDLETVFAAELTGVDRTQMREWYNGYNWTGEAVYNPFDALLFFRERQYKPFWFETGTPTFLIEVLTERGFFPPTLEHLRGDISLLSSFDVESIATEALLWQTGYLTFTGSRTIGARIEYTLGYPNLEVKSGLNDALIKAMLGNPGRASELESRLYDLLYVNDFDGLKTHFESLYAGIPHDWYRNNPIAQYEGFYASVFYSHIAALGLDIVLEDVTHQGRIDMTVRFNNQIYLFEFKVVELAPEGRAIQQLKDKRYADKYRSLNQPIHLIGVEFSKDSRTVVGFDV
ncbi:MAG: ATP-binding protein, partial [Methylomicrobium sp.]|nr:ATP-binding protein [Methylomicrobium sp.]